MKNFTCYEAEKFLKETAEKKLDIDNFDLNKFSSAKEITELLDVSESTANNWLAGRTDISKLGKQAIAYQLLLDLIRTYYNTPKSNIVVKKQDVFEIYSEGENGEYELLATTSNSKIARTIKEVKKIYNMLNVCRCFISTELDVRRSCGVEENELAPYQTDLRDLVDLIHYIQDGITFSEKYENLLNQPIDFNFDVETLRKNQELDSDDKDVMTEFVSSVSREYKGQIDTKMIPESTIIRRVVAKGSKKGVYELKKIGNDIVYMANGKKYQSINAASTEILGYNENVKENWYFYDTLSRQWKKCKCLVENV